jgi:hypothetical protein
MKNKKIFIELSEINSELTITSAFIGASKNFFIIENYFYELNKIPLNQYLNYLSQLAFCLELGLKNIIKITSKVWKSHDLEILFSEADKETNSNFSKKFFGSYNNKFKQDFLVLLKNTKNLFEEARYCYGNSLNYFFHDQYLINNDIIDFDKLLKSNEALQMFKLFLQELGEYHNFVQTNSLRINTEKDLNDQMGEIIKTKFIIQETIYVKEN